MTESVASARGKANDSKLPSAELRAKRRRVRTLKDKISRIGITSAGYGVVFSLALIFIYLFYEVLPILKGASIEPQATFSLPGVTEQDPLAHLIMERYQELGVSFSAQGQVTFFNSKTGAVREQEQVPVAEGLSTTTFAAGEAIGGLTAYGLSNGAVVFTKPHYELSFPNDQREITPRLSFPYGEAPIQVDPQGQPFTMLTIQESTRGRPQAFAVGLTVDQRLVAARIATRENLFTGAITTQVTRAELPEIPNTPTKMLV